MNIKKISTALSAAITVIGTAALLYACSKSSSDNTPDPGTGNGFDKPAMLQNYADNIIIPGYTAMQQKMNALQAASEVFLAAPSVTTQASVKTAYEDAYLQYENIASFQFGPAETALLDLYLNYSGGLDYNFNTAGQLTGFSIDSISIESNITSGVYNLSTQLRNSFYSQGFPALNYLFFSPNAVTKFSTNTASRTKYVRDVVSRMKLLVDNVSNAWPAYRAQFIANTQTNVGSPIGNMVNQLAYQMDLLKGPRIGWPFGKQSNGIVFASKVEARYSGISIALATQNLTALKNMYSGGAGKGIDDYLVALNRGTLNTDVLAQFDVALAKLALVPDPLSASLTTQPVAVENAYREIQKLLTLLKTDVASATAVQITFMDNDGD